VHISSGLDEFVDYTVPNDTKISTKLQLTLGLTFVHSG